MTLATGISQSLAAAALLFSLGDIALAQHERFKLAPRAEGARPSSPEISSGQIRERRTR